MQLKDVRLKISVTILIIINTYYIFTLFLDRIEKEWALQNDQYEIFRMINVYFIYTWVNFVDAICFLVLFRQVTQQ